MVPSAEMGPIAVTLVVLQIFGRFTVADVNCNQGTLNDKMVEFAGTQASYVKYSGADIPDLEQFTVCWWAQTEATSVTYMTVFHYLTSNVNSGAIYSYGLASVLINVNNQQGGASGIDIRYGEWHHVCTTWSNNGGHYQFFRDGGMTYSNVNVRASQTVAGGGLLVLGGRLVSSAGTLYGAPYAFQGHMAAFGFWNKVVTSDEIQAMAASGCASDTCGNIIGWTSFGSSDLFSVETPSTTLTCGSRNENCDNGDLDGKMLNMDSTSTISYAQSFQSIPDMAEFTMCSWIKSTDSSAAKYLVTYRSSNINTGSIYLYNPNAVRLYINNLAGTASKIAVNYGLWHHLCITWASDGGSYQYFKDGHLLGAYENLRAGQTILGGGTLIIGQWQASMGGGFNKVYSFNHEITEFNIWSDIKDADDISTMSAAPCDGSCGDVVSWPYFRSSDVSEAVVVEDSDIPCSPISTECQNGAFKGKYWHFDSSAEYTYATIDRDFRDFGAFTVCWWMSSPSTTSTYHTMMSYFAIGDSAGSIRVENPYNIRVAIDNQYGTSSQVAVNYGMWHHVCVTWTSDGGVYKIYRDGGMAYTQSSYSANEILRGGGTLIIGQRQTGMGTGFHRTYAYLGDMSDFNLWNTVLDSDEIEGFVENRGCDNGCGNVLSWLDFTESDVTEIEVEDADAVCEDRVTECGDGEFDDKKWTLESTTSQFSYATFRQSIPNLSKFSACMWVKTTATSANYYLFTYTTSNVNTGGIYLLNPNSVKLGVNNGAATASGVAINYGLWFHICQTWTSNGGAYQYYKDAKMRLSGVNLRANVEINGGGTLIIGQYQGAPGGRFNTVYSFNGEITKFNIWSDVLSSTEIEEMYTEPCGYICGDIVWWSFFRSDDTASITVEDHGLQCEKEELVCEAGPYTDKTLSFDSTAEYTYATAPEDFLDFWSFTACWWMRTNDATGQARAIFSYFASGDNPGSIIVQTASNLRACIKNVWGTSSGVSVTYGMWHHVCVTWASDGGQHEFYRDGGRAFSQSNLSVNKMLRGGGKLVIGQRQMTTGTYNRAYSYTGDLSEFNMWSEVLLTSDIEGFAENRGCENGCGDLITWSSFTSSDLTEVDVSDADAVCKDRVTECGDGEFDDKKWTLESTTSQFSYATFRQSIPNLSKFSACMWVKTTATSANYYLFTYTTSNVNTGGIYLLNPNSVKLGVNNGAATASGVAINYGLWFHICQTWTSVGGAYQYYKDANMRLSGANLRTNVEINGGGTLIIGQYQSTPGGGFNTVYSFDGEITKFNIWSKVLSSTEIEEMYTEPCGYICGDIVWWSFFRSDDTASITVEDHGLQCEEEELVCEAGPYTDMTLSFDSTAEFTYATAPEDFLDFWSFTACWWMRTNDATGQARAIFSYFASGDNPGSIIVQTASNLRACIKNVWGTSSGVSVTYGMWHHVCVTWASDGGQHEFYRDGGRVFSQSNLSVNKMLRGGGKLVIGQRQMTTGTYNRAYSYTGDLSEFNMWNEVLLASEIEGFAENRGCENGCGDLITWSSFTSSDLTEVDVSDADAVCEDRVTECGEGEFDDKKWTLESTTSQFSYATFRQSIPNLSKFSACMWVKTTATSTNYYLFTYTTSNVNTGGIYLLNPNSVKLGVNNGAATASGVAINYGLWFHICQTWTSAGGAYQYYKDANMRLSGVNLRTNVEINGGGTLIIGQYQSTPGGGFNTVYSFNGEITKFNIWSKVLSSTEIEEMYTEPCGYICGDIVWWSFFRSDDTASITVEDHGLQCEEEELVCEAGPYTNQTLSFDSTAEFTYATAPEDFLDFWSFTACWWMRTNDATGQARAIFSYFASGDNPGSIIVQTASNLRACIKNVWGTSSSISVTYGIWHHVCVTWASDGGQHEFYRDGGRAFSQSNLAVNKMLRGGGKLVIGQRQMTTGTYNRAYSYTGDLSEFNMWSEVLLASDIERFAENRGCDNGCGDLVTWASFTSSDLTEVDVSDADAVCQPRVDCENGEFDEKVLVLDSTNDFGVVQSFQTMPDLTEFTMCWWLRSSDTAAASYLVSYVTSNRATGNIYIYNPTTITLYVNNVAGIASTIRVNYGLWHHVCVTWESGGGNYFYYKDGIMTKTWYNLRKGATILGGGSLMLGQYQTSVGGGLNKVYSFDHEVSKFNIWTEVLQSRDITKLANDACDPSCGDAISWSYFRSSDISTAVTVKDSDIPCGPELPLCNGGEYDGKKWRLDNTVTYSYARSSRTVPDLFQFTVCSWVKTTDTYVYSTLFTYSAVGQTLAIMVWNFGNLQLYVNNGAATASTVTVNYDRWSHLCFTWDRSDGTYSYYHDGAVAKSGTNLKANGLIPGNGDFIIGGRLTAVDGSLMARTYFMEGEISNFNLWSTILTDDKIERIALEGCQNDCGDVLSWASFTSDELTEIEVLDSEIECRYEPECGGGPFENDTFVMDSSELWSYVQITRAVPDLQEFTMCWWMRTTDTVAYRRSLVSYFAPGAGYYSTIWVEYPTNLRMWVKGTAGPYTNIKVNYGLWHHVCFTWNSNGGTYKAYKDGELRYSSVNLRSFETIDGNGVLVLGQRQTSYGGGFHKYYAYYGDLANFNWWSEAKDADEIKGMAVAPCDSDCGDIMMWSILTASDVINVEKEENDIPCSPEMPKCYGGEFKGKVWEFDSTAEYTYVNVDKTIRDQDGLTISFWMKTTDSSNLPRSLVSYFALGDSYGSVVLEYVHNMRLWIGNQAGAFSSMEVNYGLWHHVCVTWSTVEGRYQYFKDANLAYTNINLRKDQLIRGGGEMVIGQKQASLGGGFTRNTAYIGEMTSFNVWGEVIADEAIQAMADDGCLDGCGNLVWWPSFTSDDLTEVDVVDSDIQCVDKDRCHGGTFKGKAWLLDNSVDWSYATVPKKLPDMTEFSICLWLKTPESNTNYYSTVFSYLASGDWYSSIVFSFPRNLRLYVINQWGAQTSKKVDDGSWHYLCVTWSSDGGIYKLYDQGTLQHSGSGLASGKTIKGAGSFVIGQNQYWKPGYFYRSYSWNGNIMNFNMWSTVLDKDELGSSENMCKGGCGDLMSWHEFTYFDVTSVSTTKMRCRTNPDGSIDLEEGEDETTETPPVVATTAAPEVPTEEPVVPTEEATEPVVVITAAPSITTEEFVIVTPEVTTEACIVPDDMDNFAVGGEASQSSVRGGGKPKKAIDGNADSNMSTGKSCSRTLEERDPWWMVDIGRSTNVYKVTITNRQDCCSEDLVGAEVRVGNSPNLDDNDVCGAQVTESDIANENIEIICACGEPINGRYVSVHLPGITRSLTLCEVSVGGIAVATEKPEECVVPPNLINVAAGKQASQISDAGKATASRAVDGDKNSNYKGKSCSKTGSESDPWWSVDLGESRDVYQVTITNRQDCCAERILDAEVRVGDSRNIARNALCGTKVTEDEMNQETIVLICACGDPLNGRFVSVQLAGSARALTLCEVEVWTEGTLTVAPTLAPDVSTIEFFTTEEPCVFPESIEDVIHAGSVVEQSSTKKSNVAARAVDGNKNSVLSEGSCSMTNKEFEPWFKVDLGVSRDIHQVTITNRADCCSFRLKGAVVRVGDNPDHTKNPICGGPLNDRRVKEETVPVICGCDDPMPGRYISVQLFDKTQQLTICEIEAFAMPLASPVPPAEHTTAAASYTTEEPCVLPDDVVNIVTPSTAAEQSSTKSGNDATRAVDGNKSGTLSDGHCAMTKKETEPWIQLDLGQQRQVHQVSITNRQDCCSFRLKGAVIRVGDSPNVGENPMCGSGPISDRRVRQATIDIVCGCEVPMAGRYVSVQLEDKTNTLAICELEVFAAP